MSPALAGGFLLTASPGESPLSFFRMPLSLLLLEFSLFKNPECAMRGVRNERPAQRNEE